MDNSIPAGIIRLTRERDEARAERDALAHVIEQVRAWDAKGWSEDMAVDCAELRVILDAPLPPPWHPHEEHR